MGRAALGANTRVPILKEECSRVPPMLQVLELENPDLFKWFTKQAHPPESTCTTRDSCAGRCA